MGVIYELTPEIEVYRDLTRRELERKGLFICEGIPAIESALERGIEPVSLLMERRHVTGKAAGLIEKLGDIPVLAPEDKEIERVCGFELSRGVLCAMKRPKSLLAEEVLTDGNVCVLENVRDETNIGAIFRSAAALGISAVLLTPGCSDPLSRRSVRVSMGAVFRVKYAEIKELDAGGLDLLKDKGFCCCAMALGEGGRAIGNFSAPKCAVILGNEGEGLKISTIQNSDARLYIPMQNGVDSLNVASAAAIAFFSLQK